MADTATVATTAQKPPLTPEKIKTPTLSELTELVGQVKECERLYTEGTLHAKSSEFLRAAIGNIEWANKESTKIEEDLAKGVNRTLTDDAIEASRRKIETSLRNASSNVNGATILLKEFGGRESSNLKRIDFLDKCKEILNEAANTGKSVTGIGRLGQVQGELYCQAGLEGSSVRPLLLSILEHPQVLELPSELDAYAITQRVEDKFTKALSGESIILPEAPVKSLAGTTEEAIFAEVKNIHKSTDNVIKRTEPVIEGQVKPLAGATEETLHATVEGMGKELKPVIPKTGVVIELAGKNTELVQGTQKLAKETPLGKIVSKFHAKKSLPVVIGGAILYEASQPATAQQKENRSKHDTQATNLLRAKALAGK